MRIEAIVRGDRYMYSYEEATCLNLLCLNQNPMLQNKPDFKRSKKEKSWLRKIKVMK